MSCDFAVNVEVCTLAGAVLVDLNDAASGYELVSSSMPDEEWRRQVVTSPFVDGDFETQAVLSGARFECVVRVKGDSWAQVEQRRLAMRTAWADKPAFLLNIVREGVGVTYRARRPDVAGSVATIDLMNNRRLLSLSFPVQPNPTVSGV